MSGLFGVLGIASRAMGVNQRNLSVTSHNIANEATPGYSRQRLVTQSAPAIPDPRGHLGTGVEAVSVDRAHDVFVERRLLAERSALGSSDSQASVLAQIEEVFNEQQGPGLSSLLGSLYSSFADLASAGAPGAAVEREAVRAAAASLMDELHLADGELRTLQRNLDSEIAAGVTRVNEILGQIATLNEQVVAQETAAPANDLRDSRDRLVRELADFTDITMFEQASGAVSVLLGGGMTLVEGGTARLLGTTPDPTNAFDPSFTSVLYDPTGASVDVTGSLSGGRLGGLLRSRDATIPAGIRALDTLAYNLTVQVNTVHAAGVGLDGSVGNFFQGLPGVEDAAQDIAFDPAIAANVDAIAAGLTSDPGDNRNALELAAQRDVATAIFVPGDPPGPPSGPVRTLQDHMASIIADVGQQTQLAQSGRAQRERTLELLENRRDEISGVSIDEEVINLVRIQAVYQANARVVSTVNELLESLISIL